MKQQPLFEHVLQSGLHSTLTDYGFATLTPGDYVLEKADRVLIFELDMMPEDRPGFSATAAIHFPKLDETIRRIAPDLWIQTAGTRNRAHVAASIPQLIEIASGRSSKSKSMFGLPKGLTRLFEKSADWQPDNDFHHEGYWLIPDADGKWPPQNKDISNPRDFAIDTLGSHLDSVWKTYAANWYDDCEDRKYLIDWMVKQEVNGYGKEILLGVLSHLLGDRKMAAFCLSRPVKAAVRSDEKIYEDLKDRYGETISKSIVGGSGVLTPSEMEYRTRLHIRPIVEHADVAKKIANELGIPIQIPERRNRR